MSETQDIPALLAGTEGFSELSSSDQERIVSMVGGVEEVVGVQHLVEAPRQQTNARRRRGGSMLRRF